MDYLFRVDQIPAVLAPFLTLSYPVETPAETDCFHDATYYDIGYKDLCLMVSLIALMAVGRDAARLGLLEPFASWKLTRDANLRRAKAIAKDEKNASASANGNAHAANGNGAADRLSPDSAEARRIHRKVMRFGEQGWQFLYYTFQWLLGLYVYQNASPELWSGYPHIPLPGVVKFYYLQQMSFYVHAVLVLNAEAKRKDHWQMMSHHIITIVLTVLSYTYNFTRVGCLIMVIMDFCDIILPSAKLLRYLGFQTLCDIAFGLFLISWVVTRHVLFIMVTISVYYMPGVKFAWDPARKSYLTQEVAYGFVALLVTLEILQAIWCYMIFRVAWRVVMGYGADDTRSDDEE
ncbi:longevity assurance proteins LAG1/LAC1 [Dentipellis sp. KUC8613]|nr:longevity assurance proteins LAG1/LAC1 [Dentipellis sp. KUC8613]